MENEKAIKNLYELDPSTIVDMFIIDTTMLDFNRLPINEQIIRLHNFNTPNGDYIYFNGERYIAAPSIFSGNEIKSDGTQLPRPRFGVTNILGYASKILAQTNGLLGAKFTRKRTFAKFLDAETWPDGPPSWSEPDSGAIVSEDIFYVDKKIVENKNIVELELATAIELEGVKLPKRKMFATACSFLYRNSSGCGYTDEAISDIANRQFYAPTGQGGYGYSDPSGSMKGLWNNATEYNAGDSVYILSRQESEIISGQLPDGTINTGSFKYFVYVCRNDNISGSSFNPIFDRSNWITDSCSKKIIGCKLRYGEELNFGGFPALSRRGFAE